jgi:glutathione S-transferase
VFKTLLGLLLRLSPARADKMLATIRSCLQKVDDRLADGRSYLLGDRFTLSDMAFAIAAAPIVWPDQYGGAVPALADTPPALQAVVAECRARPSGALALRIYRDHRDGSDLPTVTTTTTSTERGALDGVHR